MAGCPIISNPLRHLPMAGSSTEAKFDLSVPDLEKMAKQLRRHVIEMIATAGSGHPGGSLSAADIVTALYFKVMRHDPKNLQWPDRDRFVLSKGHAAPILYAALAEYGYFPVGELSPLREKGRSGKRLCLPLISKWII